MRVLGVDPGEVRVGLALSDEVGSMAFPLTVARRKDGLATLVRVVTAALAERIEFGSGRGVLDELDIVVVGLPLRLDGHEGEAARRVRRFGDALAKEIGVAVVYWDERLTTVSAERTLRTMGVRGSRQRAVVDQTSAAIILQSYLDARKTREKCDEERDEAQTTWDKEDSAREKSRQAQVRARLRQANAKQRRSEKKQR